MLVDFFKLTDGNKITHASHTCKDLDFDHSQYVCEGTYVMGDFNNFTLSEEANALIDEDSGMYVMSYHYMDKQRPTFGKEDVIMTLDTAIQIWDKLGFKDSLLLSIGDLEYASTETSFMTSAFMDRIESKGFYLEFLEYDESQNLFLMLLKRAKDQNMKTRTLTL